MAADGGRPTPTVEAQLYHPVGGRLFDFFQAVTLLEALARAVGRASSNAGAHASVGEGGDPTREAVRFAGTVRLAFPTSDIAAITRPDGDGGQAAMTVNFMSLAGALGPLPAPFAEIVLGRAVAGDTAARDFLDIFNHRLISLVYRIRRRHRIALGVASPVADDAARYLFALVGLGTAGLRGRLAPVEDRTLLFYAGLLSREVRSIHGLVVLLRRHFSVPVEGTPLVGGFYPIEPTHRTVIGPSGKNRRLGEDAVLGSRYWDPSACLELRIGPLSVEDYLRFLPGTPGIPPGDRLAPLLALVRFYAGETVDARIRLVLQPAAAARSRKGRQGPELRRVQRLGERPRLGYTAWVGRAFAGREVVLESAAMRDAAGGPRSGSPANVTGGPRSGSPANVTGGPRSGSPANVTGGPRSGSPAHVTDAR
jgi:type VI secretion system protein ImpH